ncbi:MAG: hypothetical protein K6F37_02820 [Lachnospiraceae bacterium]|nr:hypothetical protein [Lachnospiraceae bacterium]
MKELLKRTTPKTFAWMAIGVFITGLGNAVLRLSTMGTDPYTSMNLGLANYIPVSYGTIQATVGLLFFIPVIICYRHSIGFGTFANMLGLAYISDFLMWVFKNVGYTPDSLSGNVTARIVLMLLGVLFVAFGLAMYFEADLGVASFDSLAPMIVMWSKGKIKFFQARVIGDVSCLVIGFLLGAIIGPATVIIAVGLGPMVAFFRGKLAPFCKSEVANQNV